MPGKRYSEIPLLDCWWSMLSMLSQRLILGDENKQHRKLGALGFLNCNLWSRTCEIGEGRGFDPVEQWEATQCVVHVNWCRCVLDLHGRH